MKLYLDRFKKKKVDTLNVVKTYFLLQQMIVYYHVESLEDGQMTSPSFLFRKRKKEENSS